MACKRPVLMAIDGVSRELVEESMGGTYVEPENPQHYKEVISQYLVQPDRAAVEGQNGYNYVKEYFDREILAEKYLKLIKEKALQNR